MNTWQGRWWIDAATSSTRAFSQWVREAENGITIFGLVLVRDLLVFRVSGCVDVNLIVLQEVVVAVPLVSEVMVVIVGVVVIVVV